MANPTIYGPDYSTYVRTTRLAHEEKGVAYDLVPVDILSGEAVKPPHSDRHPFGKVPAYEHDGFTLYETPAIIRYVDQVFDGPSLVPSDARHAARMTQVVSIMESYGYPCLLGTIVWQRIVVPMVGGEPDQSLIDGAQDRAATVLKALADIKGANAFMAGPELSLADIFVAPVFDYLMATPDAEALLKPHGSLREWWSTVSARETMAKTAPNL